MDELEEIKRRKLEGLKKAYELQAEQESDVRQQIEELEAIARNVLTKDALQRYSNIKLVDPEKATHLLVVMAQAVQQGLTQINDDQLKSLLRKLTAKKDFNIRRI